MTTAPLRILVVDDDALIINVIQGEIERKGHTVVGRAGDGRRAVELVETLQPDVVLMDIEMPEMDGLEATALIQERSRPVVLLTAHDDPDLVDRAGAVGANAYLVKPPDGTTIVRTIAMARARFADLMELRRLNKELRTALEKVRVLSGLLPICMHCKKIRDDKGYWQRMELYVMEHSEVVFSHGLCETCATEHYGDVLGKA